MWIWNCAKYDFAWLHLHGGLAIAASFLLVESSSSLTFLIIAFVAKEFLDSGHVYTTLWRTYFNPTERSRSGLYIFVPVFLFGLFFAWTYSGIAHFRTGEIWNSYYSGGGALRWPNEILYHRLLWGYLAIIVIWIGYEVSILRRHREWNRTLSVGFPAAVYGFCILYGRTITEVLFPLVVSHGVA